MKAIVAMNLYALGSVLFILLSKKCINDMNIKALDFTLIINLACLPIPTLIVYCQRKLSFMVPPDTRKMFAFRAFEGWLLIVVYIAGNALLPVTIN